MKVPIILAIDAILEFFDNALLEGNLAKGQETLREIDPSKLSASMVKTVLVITGKAKAWRPERAGILRKGDGCPHGLRGKAGCRAAIE